MPIKFILRKKEMQLEGKSIQVKQALELLNLSPESHLLVREGDLLNENDWLSDGDEIKVVPVISGGSFATMKRPQAKKAAINRGIET